MSSTLLGGSRRHLRKRDAHIRIAIEITLTPEGALARHFSSGARTVFADAGGSGMATEGGGWAEARTRNVMQRSVIT